MSDNTTETDAEELLQSSKDQDRFSESTAPPTEAENATDQMPLDEAVADALDDVESGDLSSNLTMRDDRLAALVAALEETGDIETLNERLHDSLDRDEVADVTRSNILAMAVRVALSETDAEILDAARDGYRLYLQRQADEY